MQFRSGKLGTATINGNGVSNEIPLISWDVEPSVDIVMFRNSKTGNFPYREATFFDATVSLVLDVDFDAYPFAAPTNLYVGQLLSPVFLYLRQPAGPSTFGGDFWRFPKVGAPASAGLIVQSTPMSLSIDGKVGTSVTCVASGPFQYPTGLVPNLNF